jgi:CHAD domain-containing protein
MAKDRTSSFDANQPYCAAMRERIADRFGTLWKAVPAAIAGDDIEGVHDVRVASRRLRAAMDVAVDCFPAEWYRPLHKTAKEITSALGEVRDRDVILESLQAERESAAPEEWPGIDRVIARIERERGAARAAMIEFLSSLDESQTAREAAHRFGPAAAKPSGPAGDQG